MSSFQFEDFIRKVESTPPGAIFMTLEQESRTLVDTLKRNRLAHEDKESVESILIFWRFIEAAKAGLTVSFFGAPFPASSLEFYRTTIDRLVAAQELPMDAQKHFDRCFVPRPPDGTAGNRNRFG